MAAPSVFARGAGADVAGAAALSRVCASPGTAGAGVPASSPERTPAPVARSVFDGAGVEGAASFASRFAASAGNGSADGAGTLASARDVFFPAALDGFSGDALAAGGGSAANVDGSGVRSVLAIGAAASFLDAEGVGARGIPEDCARSRACSPSALGSSSRAASARRRACSGTTGMSDTTPLSVAGAPTRSGAASCRSPIATAPIVAAAASGHHHRWGRRALALCGAAASTGRGPACASRRAAARIASSSAAGGSSRECARHAASKRGSRRSFASSGPRVVTADLPGCRGASRAHSGCDSSRSRRRPP